MRGNLSALEDLVSCLGNPTATECAERRSGVSEDAGVGIVQQGKGDGDLLCGVGRSIGDYKGGLDGACLVNGYGYEILGLSLLSCIHEAGGLCSLVNLFHYCFSSRSASVYVVLRVHVSWHWSYTQFA